MPDDPRLLRPIWRRLASSPLLWALALYAILTGLRFLSLLDPDGLRSVMLMSVFLLMWCVPIVMLTPYGRRRIGLLWPAGGLWPLVAAGCGAGLAALFYAIGWALYGRSDENWFVSVGYTYQLSPGFSALPQYIAFISFTVPAMVFSPIGEELFFRGFVQESAAERWNWRRAALLNAALFAFAHLAHHGLYRLGGELRVFWISGALWFILMFAASLVFTFLRHRHRSIWASVLGHAAFNLAMNYLIFYHLFVSKPALAG